MVAHPYNLCTQEARARGSYKFKANLGLNSKVNKLKKIFFCSVKNKFRLGVGGACL